MIQKKFSLKDIPSWLVMLAIFGVLYVTGYHTEVIGQAQRLLLSTGLIKPKLPKTDVQQEEAFSAEVIEAADFLMTDLEGNPVSFESLRGKIIFLNIWATWCPPCIAEMPNIQSLYEKVKSEDIAFVMLSVDESGTEKVKKFIERKGYTFPVYLPAGYFPKEFSSNAIPATFIISPPGKIVAKHEGMANYDSKEMEEFLKNLIKN